MEILYFVQSSRRGVWHILCVETGLTECRLQTRGFQVGTVLTPHLARIAFLIGDDEHRSDLEPRTALLHDSTPARVGPPRQPLVHDTTA